VLLVPLAIPATVAIGRSIRYALYHDNDGKFCGLKKTWQGEIGLCERCVHLHAVKSAKGSTFTLCKRSEYDARFPKYPRLPVITCSGFEENETDRHRREIR
jgi:hypothetical protein